MKHEVKCRVTTLLWLDVLDKFEDDFNRSFYDKYINFIENNGTVEEMDIEEFKAYVSWLADNKYLTVDNDDEVLEISNLGQDMINKLATNEKLKVIMMSAKESVGNAISRIWSWIEENHDTLEIIIATTLAVEVLG